MQIPIASCAPEIMPSDLSGSFSKQKTSFASISGSILGSSKGQILRIAFLVEVERPPRSMISNVGSTETVIAQPGAYCETYGWSIQVPAKSTRVGIRQILSFKEVLDLTSKPSEGFLFNTTYSIPLSSQNFLFHRKSHPHSQ